MAHGVGLAIQVVLIVCGAWWYLYWILEPIPAGKAWLDKINSHTNWKFLGTRGSTFLLQAVPVFVTALLAYILIELRRRRRLRRQSRGNGKPKVNVWTLPIVLRSPLGMLTLADFAFIFVTLFAVFFYLIKSIVDDFRLIDNSPPVLGEAPLSPSVQKLEKAALRFGLSALIPFALLWIPVSRSSPILRVAGVPFERAVKYHTWLGLLTISLLIVHGACFIAFFILMHQPKDLIQWHQAGVSIIPGWIALTVGLAILVTSLTRVRRKNFNIFFVGHHLYLAFLIFFAFHAPSLVYFYVVPVLLFFIDRFMRMVQSRKRVDVLSARVLSSGTMELKFAKPSSLEYYPLSFLYVMFPSVSRFEWHPFSVASSPFDSAHHMSIYIKPLGGYTQNLHHLLLRSSQSGEAEKLSCPFSFKLSLEGSYGDESSFFLKYKSLVLVAGGIGITPFLAIIRDIIHRHRLEEEDLPTDIQLIYCVRTPKDLCMLDTLNLEELCPNYAERVNIVFRPYVTHQIKPQNRPEDSQAEPSYSSSSSYEESTYIHMNEPVAEIFGKPISESKPVSAIHATGHSGWVAATVLSTMVGFFVLWGIFSVTIIDEEFPGYFKVMLYFFCMALAVTVFGGCVIFFWSLSLKRRASKREKKVHVASRGSSSSSPVVENGATEPSDDCTDSSTTSSEGASPWLGNVTHGRRPDWKDLFEQIAKQYEGRNVGVLVSGSLKMQEDVARECRHQSLSKNSNVVLHYHSVSFEL